MAAADKPEVWHIRGEGGAVHRMQRPFGEGIDARLRSGALARVNPDGTPYTGESAVVEPSSLAEVRAEREKAENARDLPPRPLPHENARKAAWVDYAISRGLTRNAAEDLTRDELVVRYGG